MKRLVPLCVIILAACDGSPTGPGSVPEEIEATPEAVTVYTPALNDSGIRILSTGTDVALMRRLSQALEDLGTALEERRARNAERAVSVAHALVQECDDECLAAPERSVIELTLAHARRLIRLQDSE